MTKEIQIGESKVLFGASALLPVLYRELTGREFFEDTSKVGDSGSIAYDMAWVMFRDANPDSNTAEVDWLRQFNFVDFNNALPEIVDLMLASQSTKSAAKNQGAR